MKIPVYQIETVSPEHNSNEYFEILDILNIPSLKYGTVEFIGKFDHFITKKELKKIKSICAKFYNRNTGFWMEGLLLLQSKTGKKMFAQYSGKL